MSALRRRGADPADPDLSRAIAQEWAGELQDKFGDRPPTSTVREWMGRGDGEDITLADFMSMSGRVPRKLRLDRRAEAVIEDEKGRYYKNRGNKHVDVEAAVKTRIAAANAKLAPGEPPIPIPSRETIRRRVGEMLCRETYASKFGEDAARRKWDGSGRGVTAGRILQLGIMDDTVVDLVTCLDADRGMIAGRPHLCVLIDVHSRCVLSLLVSFEPPTVATAAQCIRLANRPKLDVRPDRLARYPGLARINGKLARILTDNGANYVARGFGEVLMDVGITHELAPVKAPRHKAIVERFFRTLNTFLIDKLPGATLDPSILRKLGIDPEAEAVVTLGELKEFLEHFLYVYHITHHAGIDAQPLAKWERSMNAVGRTMILDEQLLDVVTGTTVHGKRVTANGGIRMFGMTWKGENLVPRVIEPLAGKEPHGSRLEATTAATTKVKYNSEDMLHIQVFNGKDWIALENTQPDYAAGLPLWQHQQVRAYAKRRALEFNSEAERMAARDELNAAIREAFPDMKSRERRAVARMMGSAATPEPAIVAEFAEAEPRHDGMGPIIGQELAATHRDDAQRRPDRPSKGGEKGDAAGEPGDAGEGDDGVEAEISAETGEDEPVIHAPPFLVPPAAPDDDDHDEEYR